MTRSEKLNALAAARDALWTIAPRQSGKGQHRCAVCIDSGKHPCPVSKCMECHATLMRRPT